MPLAILLLISQEAPGHWPQWRGPARDNVSSETGLLKSWPEGGPKLLWTSKAAGDGSGPVSVAGGLVFAQGCKDEKYVITAMDGTGRVVWEAPIGPKTGEYALMRFLGQRSITVDDDRVFACDAQGRLVCLDSASGRLLWEKSYRKDLSGEPYYVLGYCDAPLVEKEALICAPGGKKGTLAALNKRTGEVLWRSEELKDPMPTTAVVAADIGGIRQFVVLTMTSLAGIDARNGRLLWRGVLENRTMVATTPIVGKDVVLATSGYGVGWNAFRVEPKDGGGLAASLLYEGKQTRHHRGVTLVGEHVYAAEGHLKRFDLKTGTLIWAGGGRCYGAVLGADGHLIARDEGRGSQVVLAEPAPEEYREKGRFTPAEISEEAAYSLPVLAGGRLYLRDVNLVLCYDVRGPDYQDAPPVWRIRPTTPAPPAPVPGKGPDAAFVPTPEDVVEKMLEAADLGRLDVLYDLGSGDGRVLMAAARKGCRAVGFEIEPVLVRDSRAKAKGLKLEDLVTIEEKDLFTADLSAATIVTLYLGEANNARLLPKLRALKPGVRIVSHQHRLGPGGPPPDRTVQLVSSEDQLQHAVHLWTTPLKSR
jgi:outer membrane protein assembly factor BamB